MKKILLFISLFFTSIIIANAELCVHISGDGTHIGDEIACGTEHFYVISNDGENIRMMAKYNLLVGTNYYRVEFSESYENSNDIYLNKKLQEKLMEGYSVSWIIDEYDAVEDKNFYTGAVLYKNVLEDNIENVFFSESETKVEALNNSEVKEQLKKGYILETYQLSNGEYIGVKIFRDTNYQTIILNEPVDTREELFYSSEVKNADLDYKFSDYIFDENGKYIGVIFNTKEDTDYKTIIFDNKYSTFKEAFSSNESKEVLNEGYRYYSAIQNSNKEYIGLQYIKEEDMEYKTVFVEFQNGASGASSVWLYSQDSVKEVLDSGYYGYNTYYEDIVLESDPYVYSFYAITLAKNKNYDYKNVFIFDEQLFKDAFLENLNESQEYQQYIADGYELYKYYYAKSVYSGSSWGHRYFGVILRKCIGTCNTKEELALPLIYQDETALGAHDGEAGKPAPDEIGVIQDGGMYGFFSDEYTTYSEGYRNFSYYDYNDSYYYLESYKNILNANGYEIIDINSITVSEINDIVKEVTGKEIPLKEWYINGVGWSEDPVTGDEFYILGSIKDLMPEEYSWLWGTTYWTRTADPDFDGIYFVDTLGDLCTAEYCKGTIGAGLRPVVTISVEDVIYKIETKTDGNGTVKADYVEAKEGTVVKFTVTPKEGYVLGEVKVTDENGNVVIFTDYTFTMPNANVLIEATFIPINPETTDKVALIIITTLALGLIIIHNNKKRIALD